MLITPHGKIEKIDQADLINFVNSKLITAQQKYGNFDDFFLSRKFENLMTKIFSNYS